LPPLGPHPEAVSAPVRPRLVRQALRLPTLISARFTGQQLVQGVGVELGLQLHQPVLLVRDGLFLPSDLPEA